MPGAKESFIRDLIYRKSGRLRFTQNSPILPDVYARFADDPHARISLLITPDWKSTPPVLAEAIKKWLADYDSVEAEASDKPKVTRDLESLESAQIAFNQSVVAVDLSFSQLVRWLLPLSFWWKNRLISISGLDPLKVYRAPRLRKVMAEELAVGLSYLLSGLSLEKLERRHWIVRQELIWAVRLFAEVERVGLDSIAECSEPNQPVNGGADSVEAGQLAEEDAAVREADRVRACRPRAELIVERFMVHLAKIDEKYTLLEDSPESKPVLYSVSRNRPIQRTLIKSVATIKADAATRTFDVRGEGIRWAVIDTGIDARHVAFRKKTSEGEIEPEAFGDEKWPSHTRIVATYDFSGIRRALSTVQKAALTSQTGRLLDWDTLSQEGKLRIPHERTGYRPPSDPHGTHVAGILAADWSPDDDPVDPVGPPPARSAPDEPLHGVCPQLELYDLRVFDQNGNGDEFAVMSALQFVRSLNQRHDSLEVHGVNISLALDHDVSNYGCGKSPVCEECSRLVGNGVVVVAAAGNDGRALHVTTLGCTEEGYRSVSIADPGNAEAVITVGATHKRQPHTYGVSYFSSRGPTGDGRLKPDLVAPGEKILSTMPCDRMGLMDGTSQAAPHVSGAAALLMSRHRELIGEPAKVKDVLLRTATDLGRDRCYQGRGLVDVLRAIQSL